jgi:hypothetical protein
MIKDLRKRLTAETKAVKREHPKYARTLRAKNQQDEEIRDLREQITNLLSRVISSPVTEAPHRSGSVPLEAADIASMTLSAIVQNLTKLPDNRSSSDLMVDFVYGIHVISSKAGEFARQGLSLPSVNTIAARMARRRALCPSRSERRFGCIVESITQRLSYKIGNSRWCPGTRGSRF